MASVNKTVRDVAARMSAPMPKMGHATHISVEKAKGGYISSTEYRSLNKGETAYIPPVKTVHKTLSSVKQHMAHAFNEADAEET